MKTLFFALCFAPTLSLACIWLDGTTLEGEYTSYSPITDVDSVMDARKETPAQKLKALSLESHPAKDEAGQEEREAVKAMLEGNPAGAVKKLEAIEQTSPGRYQTATNLGTAYELAGDNKNALRWINEGIKRNTNSHYGTEWLHRLILETKIKLSADPDYLKTHRIITLPEKFDAGTKVKIAGAEADVFEIAQALSYQLSERLVFVKPTDPVVADLLFTYATLTARLEAVENGIVLLTLAKEYGFSDPTLLAQTAEKYAASVTAGASKPRKKKH